MDNPQNGVGYATQQKVKLVLLHLFGRVQRVWQSETKNPSRSKEHSNKLFVVPFG